MSRKNIKANLDRLGAHVTGAPKSSGGPSAPQHYHDLAAQVEGVLVDHCGGTVCRVVEHFPEGHRHGTLVLTPGLSGKSFPLAAFEPKSVEGEVPISQLLFFDTETTGLAGAGAVAFLVGVGSVTESQFVVRQYLVPDYSDESAMMELLLDEFGPDKCLVSFNGASFDLPLLESRMIINRAARKIPHGHHIDLLHASRRLFRRRLKDCTLVNLERELFGFNRVDDIPGYLIPTVYFDWVQDRRTDDLKSVLLHNRLDILSLYFLLDVLSEAHRTEGKSLNAISDLYSLSRLYNRQKNVNSAELVSRRIEQESVDSDDDIRFHNALIFKRSGRDEEAVLIWESLAGSKSKQGFLACIELAKYLEHRRKDFGLALRFVLRAQEISCDSPALMKGIKHRIDRLRRKLSK